MGDSLLSSVNHKGLLFAGFVISVYYLPIPSLIIHNVTMVFLLGIISYTLLAWYDYKRLYNCYAGWITGNKLNNNVNRLVNVKVFTLVMFVFVYAHIVK